MKKLVVSLLCVLALVGCKEKTLDDLRAEVAAREAAKAAEEARRAAKPEVFAFVGAKGYTYEVVKVCLNGILYYTGDHGHSVALTPAISDVTFLPMRCGN